MEVRVVFHGTGIGEMVTKDDFSAPNLLRDWKVVLSTICTHFRRLVT